MSQPSWPATARAVLLVLLMAPAASASIGLPLTLEALTARADLIVLGRVTRVESGADAQLNGVYTYVTLEPAEVFKGQVAEGPLVVKQQGGVFGTRGVYVHGQATFAEGELVLLFLGTRLTDGSRFTIGLWQGKWSVDLDAVTAQPTASKREPESKVVIERHSLEQLRRDFPRLVARDGVARGGSVREASPDVRRQQSPFVLNDPPVRWQPSSVAVNVETGAQPGLPGGGLGEIVSAVAQWNSASSSLALRPGSRVPARCQNSVGSDILITFNDPCGEISSDPSLLAVAVFGFNTTGGQVINGQLFLPITDAVITTSAHPAARALLSVPSCFQSTIAHELGHAIGLDHTPDASALMYFQETGACYQGPIPLAPDDLAGLFTIYPAGGPPPSGGGAPGQPMVTTATVSGGFLNLTWTSVAGAAPTSHRLDFFAGSALVASVNAGPGSSISIPIPPGTVGTFSVQVTALVGGTPGAPSPPFSFTIGGTTGGGCTTPPAAPVVTGTLTGGTATVSWPAVPGATSYVVSAGSTPGAANIAPAANVGLTTTVSASGLPAGFSAWVRILAVNACGQSAPGDFFLSSASPAAPVAGGFLQFVPGTNACACWKDSIVLEVDGQQLGTMSCSTGAGPFPVGAGAHVYRACDVLGCVSSNVSIETSSTLTISLSCQ